MNITTMTGARNTEMFIMTTKNTRKLTTMKMLLKVRNTFILVKKDTKKSIFIYVFSLWDHPYIMSAILHTHLEYDVRFFENPPTYFLRIIK